MFRQTYIFSNWYYSKFLTMQQTRYKVRDIVDKARATELVSRYGSPLYVYS